MRYNDRVYGQVEIQEPVILELLASFPLQRLKHIDQAGFGQAFYPGKTCSRFEHSVGTYLLLKKFKAPLTEQIAGLIHDVSHSTFSHAADYIFKTGSEEKQTHQDNIFVQYVKKSVIPNILQKYHLDTDYLLNEKNFPLLETDLPDLCADRIDYSLRDAVFAQKITSQQASHFISHLVTINQQWVFRELTSAKQYARLFSSLNKIQWSSLTTAAMFKSISECMQYAVSSNYLSLQDLYTTDQKVIAKLKKHLKDDFKLRHLFKRMNNKVAYEDNAEKSHLVTSCKSRVIDPLVQHQAQICRLSDIYPSWKTIVKEELKPKQYYVYFTR